MAVFFTSFNVVFVVVRVGSNALTLRAMASPESIQLTERGDALINCSLIKGKCVQARMIVSSCSLSNKGFKIPLSSSAPGSVPRSACSAIATSSALPLHTTSQSLANSPIRFFV